jgi:hypothetical protein
VGFFNLSAFAVLALAAGVTAMFLRRQMPGSARKALVACAAGQLFCALLMLGLAALHTAAVLLLAIRRLTGSAGTPFEYNFHLYSVLLLGAVLLGLSIHCLRAAPGLARGDPGSWHKAVRGHAGLLGVNLPLIPIQAFAVAFAVLSGVSLLLLAVARRWRADVLFWPLLFSFGLLSACAEEAAQAGPGPRFQPSEPRPLFPDTPNRKDEDPSVLRAQDGTLFVAWFSERDGNPEIYVTSTSNGIDWTGPAQVTHTSLVGNFNPSLIQDEQGQFHLAWFRWDAPFHGHIWYNRSADGLSWDPNEEIQATRAFDVDDWVPTLTQAADGTLLAYFVSEKREPTDPATNDIYVAAWPPMSSAWNPVVPLPDINSATEHDHLPFAARTGEQITLVWVRHDTSEATPWINRRSDLFCATSSDGLSWSTPVQITDEPGEVKNLFPGLYPRHDGEWRFAWLSTRLSPERVFELPVANAGLYPQGLIENAHLPPGYSHRIAPAAIPGIYLGVWVQGSMDELDLYYRFYGSGTVGTASAASLLTFACLVPAAGVGLRRRKARLSRSALV